MMHYSRYYTQTTEAVFYTVITLCPCCSSEQAAQGPHSSEADSTALQQQQQQQVADVGLGGALSFLYPTPAQQQAIVLQISLFSNSVKPHVAPGTA